MSHLKFFICLFFVLSFITCNKSEQEKIEISSVKEYFGKWEFIYSWSQSERGAIGTHYIQNDSVYVEGTIQQGSLPDRILIKISGRESFDLKVESDGKILNTCNPKSAGECADCSGNFIGDSILFYKKYYGGGPNMYITNITKLRGKKIKNHTTMSQPAINSLSATAITYRGVVLKASVTSESFLGSFVFEYGLTASYGNQASAIISAGTNAQITASAHLSGLLPCTDYHFRLSAKNYGGTTYSNEMIFKTFCDTGHINDSEGNKYNTASIGDQIWMTENLRNTHLNDGTRIPVISGSDGWSSISAPGCCWFNNDEVLNKSTLGALYNWYAVNTGKLCPAGWHVPDTAEWSRMVNYLIDDKFLADRLKSASTLWGPDAGNNETMLSALPGGYRKVPYFIPGTGNWWTSSEYNRSPEYAEYVTIDSKSVVRSWKSMYWMYKKQDGLSVRCIKDK